MTVTRKVPKIAGKIPPSVIPWRGARVRNSQLIAPPPLADDVVEEKEENGQNEDQAGPEKEEAQELGNLLSHRSLSWNRRRK